MSCFAAKGYDATTIIDIERAAGLSAGSGATYRHFDSKQQMLQEAIVALEQRREQVMATPSTSAAGTAHDAINLGRHNADLFRILFRDLGQFPDLRQQVIDGLVEGVYRVAADRAADLAPNGDAEAIAVVLCNATLGFTLLEGVLGVAPLGVNADRFADAFGRLLELLIADEHPAEEPTSREEETS